MAPVTGTGTGGTKVGEVLEGVSAAAADRTWGVL